MINRIILVFMRYDDENKRKKNRYGGRSGPFVLCRKEYMKKAFVL